MPFVDYSPIKHEILCTINVFSFSFCSRLCAFPPCRVSVRSCILQFVWIRGCEAKAIERFYTHILIGKFTLLISDEKRFTVKETLNQFFLRLNTKKNTQQKGNEKFIDLAWSGGESCLTFFFFFTSLLCKCLSGGSDDVKFRDRVVNSPFADFF